MARTETAAPLGDSAALLEKARLCEQEHRIAETLQRSLLPERLPSIPGFEITSRYLPGAAGAEVGGDWYDVVPLTDGRIVMAIGDVVGKGVRAASIMGQLRTALRICIFQNESASEMVEALDQLIPKLEMGSPATLFCAVYDPDRLVLTYVCAGHPPPLVRRISGSVEFLDEEPSVPVGITPLPRREEATVALEPGATLLLYSDGLIERREIGIDAGLHRLKTAVALGPDGLEELADQIVERIVTAEQLDDIALLMVRPTLPATAFDVSLPAHPRSLISARHALKRWLRSVGMGDEEAFDVVCACSEACANSIEHAYGLRDSGINVHAHLDGGEVVLIVTDSGHWRVARTTKRGRGIRLIRALMDSVEINRHHLGTEITMRKRHGSAQH